jgi:hypothetical protein
MLAAWTLLRARVPGKWARVAEQAGKTGTLDIDHGGRPAWAVFVDADGAVAATAHADERMSLPVCGY